MLDTVTIKGFLSHRMSKLKFHPFVNLIMGNSDKGKSTIIRLIRWVEQNKPNGDSFINWNMDSASGSIKTKEGDVVERNKGKGINNYVVNGEEPLEAMGQGVPEEVSDILNLSPINYSLQSSPHFLLTSTPGQIAKTINEIADLTIIDTAIKNIQTKARENTAAIKETKNGVLEASIKIQELSFIDKLQDDYAAVLSMSDRLGALETNSSELGTILYSCSELEDSMKKTNSILELGDSVSNLEEMVKIIKEIEGEEAKLSRSIATHENVALLLANLPDLESLEGKIKNIEDIAEQIEEIEESGRVLKGASSDIAGIMAEMAEIDRQISIASDSLKVEMPDECPLCGRN